MAHMSDIQNLLRYIGVDDLKYFEFDVFGLRPALREPVAEPAPTIVQASDDPPEPMAAAGRIALRPLDEPDAAPEPPAVLDSAIWLSLRGGDHGTGGGEGAIASNESPMDLRDYGARSTRSGVRRSVAAVYTPPPDENGGDENGDEALSEFFKKL